MFGYTSSGVIVAAICVVFGAVHAVLVQLFAEHFGDANKAPRWLSLAGWAGLVLSAIISPMHVLTPVLYAVIWRIVLMGLDPYWIYAKKLAYFWTVVACILATGVLYVASATHRLYEADTQASEMYWNTVPKFTVTSANRVGQALVIRFAETDSVIIGRVYTYDRTEDVRQRVTQVQVGRGDIYGHTFKFIDREGNFITTTDESELFYVPSSLD